MVANTVYGASAAEIADLFAEYLEGDAGRPAIALASQSIGDDARNAIEKSLGAFGYSAPACSYVVLQAGDVPLDPQAIFLLIEGLDPLFVIACDKPAAEQLAQAFRAAFDLDAPARIAGRPAAVFGNLEDLLQTPHGKQLAWKVFKSFST